MQLEPNEPAVSGLWRIFREELRSARAQLIEERADYDEAIHEARRCLRRARSILKLLAPALGERYAREDSRLGNIGRRLSPFRDAAAIIETFDELHKKYRGEARPQAFRAARAGFVSLKRELDRQGDLAAVMKSAAKALTTGRPWPLGSNDLAALEPGLEAAWSKGRKALNRVQKHPLPENFHALRKRVKTHRLQLNLLERIGKARPYAKRLNKLDTWLGDAHNLTVMEERMAKEPARFGLKEDVDAILRLIARRRRELYEKSLPAAEKLYGKESKSFTRRVLKSA